jgi:hypothetical protein
MVELGRWAVAGARKGNRKRTAGLYWMRAERIEERGREREGEERIFLFFFFLNFSFQIHFSNIQTSIKQNPCIRIMMHKHLLFLIYFNDI